MIPRRRLQAAALAAAVLLGACSDSDSDSDSTASGDAAAETETTSADSGRNGSSDSSNLITGSEESEGGTLSQDEIEDSVSRPLTQDELDSASDEAGDADDAVEYDRSEGEAAEEPGRIDRPERPREPEDTTFVDAGVNPFVDTRDDNQSTFALDVDTASYTVGRSWIDQGNLPDPASVRVEEWVNYFDQDYDAPRSETFAVYADGAPHPFIDDNTHLLRIGVAAREISDRQRDPVNLTFVVDVSGSMNQDGRIELVQEAMSLLVEQLDGDDEVAIVAYSDWADIHMDITSGDRTDDILDAIWRLRTGGSTNAEAGLTSGYDLADEMWSRGETNRVVLLSDGVANVGATGPESILERIGERARDDIHLISVGVGFGNFNDHLLEQLADQGDGWYAYVDTVQEAERVFVDDLVGSLQVVAEEAKVQVEFNEANVDAYRLIGFENRDIADEDFRNDDVDAGEIGAGHTVTALYEVELARGVDPGDSSEIATVTLRWNEPDARRADEVSGRVTTDLLSDSVRDTSAHYRLTAAAATFAEVLRGSRYVRGVDLVDVLESAEDAARDIGTDQAWELVDLIDAARRIR